MNVLLRATVRPVAEGKGFELLLDDLVIGTSKLQCDADLYAKKINEAIDTAGRDMYDEGWGDGHASGYDEGYNNGYEEGIEIQPQGE